MPNVILRTLNTLILLASLISCSKYKQESLPIEAPSSGEPSPVVASWKFENAWTDAIGTSHGSPVVGTSPTFTSDKHSGSAAADLSAPNARVEVGTASELTPSNLTVSFWVKRTSPWSGANMIFWAKPCQWDHADGFYVGLEASGKAITLVVSGGNFIGLNGDPDVVFALNTWSHVAVTWDSTLHEGHIFVNGVDQPLTTFGSPQVVNPSVGTTKYIGACADGSSINWPLDDLTILNRALSADQVRSLFEATR